MSLSTVVEWLNENSHRSYPLVEDSNRYATKGVVSIDLHNLILDAALFYATLPNSITLNSIVTAGNTLTITVTDQPAFVITNYTTATYPQYVRNSNYSLLVVGDAASIPSNLTFNTAATFEACVSVEIYPNTKGVNSLTIAGTTLTGDITLTDGYQLSLIPSASNINLEVGRNEGHPLPCLNILGTTNDCSSIVSFVNGARPNSSGDKIKLISGDHVKIYDDIDNNRIYIGYDFTTNDVPAL